MPDILCLVPLPDPAPAEGEWVTVKEAANLCDVPYNDISTLIHHYHFLESKVDGRNRLVRRAQVLEKRDEIRNFPRVRRTRRAA